MIYNRMFIDTGNSEKNYHQLTAILGVIPTTFNAKKNSVETFSTWTYCVDTKEEDPYFDFINIFLDLLDPNFTKLSEIGIEKNAISFWHLYEYDQQCSMEFNPQEMKRLGESGITLCIDCWQKSE